MADFPLDFPIVFTVSIIMNRLRYIIESCQSFQTVLLSGLRNISLQILCIVGRVWNELGSRMLCQWLPSPSTTTRRLVLQNLPSIGLPALIRSPPTRAFPFPLRTTSNSDERNLTSANVTAKTARKMLLLEKLKPSNVEMRLVEQNLPVS